jgi:hypothetical protein
VEYGLIIAVVALGLFAVLGKFGNSVGDLTKRTAVSISTKSSRGFGSGGGVGKSPKTESPAPAPAPPDSSSGDSSAGALRAPLVPMGGYGRR